MPVAGNRHLKGGTWNAPQLDLGGCVLYTPFWRPDMVARGGYIKSGTGTMTVSPLNLAVGANTITATGAGTFIVTIPYGGTVASGTATITSSPVTIPAGIATSITTGVTTGNFTVTPSNIIKSKDSTGHLMTVTGATWGSQGRAFNGDDYITVAESASLRVTTGSFTIIVWVYETNQSDTFGRFLTKRVGADNWYSVYVENLNTVGIELASSYPTYYTTFESTATINGGWHMATFIRSAADSKVYIGTDDGAYESNADATAGQTLLDSVTPVEIGTWNTGGDNDLTNSIIGEILFYNGVEMSKSTKDHIYQATKWRYQ